MCENISSFKNILIPFSAQNESEDDALTPVCGGWTGLQRRNQELSDALTPYLYFFLPEGFWCLQGVGTWFKEAV